MKTPFRTLLAAPVLAACLLQPASAIVVNSTFGAAGAIAYGSGFSSVVQIVMDDSFVCTGSVISATAILTAKHCTFGFAAPDIDVRFDQNGDGVFDSILASESKFEFNAGFNNLLDGSDVAILTLTAGLMPAWATPMDLWDGNPLDAAVTMVGYGRNGVGSTAGGGIGVRWAADNVVDAVGQAPGSGSPGSTANIISTDFDDGTAASNTLGALGSSATPLAREGTTAGGDSGGPLLVNLGGTYAISGVLSGGTTSNSRFGDISWWTGISMYRTQIESFGGRFIGGSVGHVPEPGSLGLALAALIGVGVVAGMRRKPAQG
jgi:hypothetical protein